MDKYHNYPRESFSPSFSSTLLDAIYQSIEDQDQLVLHQKETMHKKHLTDNKVSENKVVVRRKSVVEYFEQRKSSSSNSSDSGNINRPKPIRTSISTNQQKDHVLNRTDLPKQKAKQEDGGFVKTKSRALKIYKELKKVKQPISPGGRLSSFLNSLFTTSGNGKKAKANVYEEERKLKSANASSSTCSSASSFSRSCLSKNITSADPYSRSAKRSVRFYLVDEDCPKDLYVDQPRFEAVKSMNNDHVAGRDLVRNYQKKKLAEKIEYYDNMRKANIKNLKVFDNEEEEYEEDDGESSCASSDLFELDNLSSIGMELPVYETTDLGTNRAISNGLL